MGWLPFPYKLQQHEPPLGIARRERTAHSPSCRLWNFSAGFGFRTASAALFLLVAISGWAAPSDFNAVATLGTQLKSSGNEVAMEEINLVSETTEPDERKRLSFNVALKNNDIGCCERPNILFDEPAVGWPVEIVQHGSATAAPDLEPNGTGSTQQPLILLAAAADAESVKTQVLATRGLTKFLQPSVYDLGGGYDQANIPGPPQGYAGTDELSRSAADQVVTTAPAHPPFGSYLLTSWTRLHAGDANAAMTFAQWCAYHGIALQPFGNADNDARSNFAEWFFGGDPYTAQNTPPQLSIIRRPDGGFRLGATRSLAARNLPFELEFSKICAPGRFSPVSGKARFMALTPAHIAARYFLDLGPDGALRRLFRLNQTVP